MNGAQQFDLVVIGSAPEGQKLVALTRPASQWPDVVRNRDVPQSRCATQRYRLAFLPAVQHDAHAARDAAHEEG